MAEIVSRWGRHSPFSPPHQRRVRIHWLVIFAAYCVCLTLSAIAARHYHFIFVWPSTGVMLAGLLLLKRSDALKLLGLGAIANYICFSVLYNSFSQCILYVALDNLEVMLAAILTRRYCGITVNLSIGRRMAAFAVRAAAPAALFRAVIDWLLVPGISPSPITNIATLLMTDIFAMTVFTPLMLALARPALLSAQGGRSMLETLGLFTLLIVVALMIFGQNQAPVPFITLLPLVWIAFRLPQHLTLIAVIILVGIASIATLEGYGPISTLPFAHIDHGALLIDLLTNRTTLMHIYAVAAVIVALPMNAAIAGEARLRIRLMARNRMAHEALERETSVRQELMYWGEHDRDSGLLNHAGLERTLDRLLAEPGEPLFLGALTIERFAAVRAAIGTQKATELLACAAARLRGFEPIVATARLGNATLGVAFRASDVAAATAFLNGMHAAFSDPLMVDDAPVDLRFCVGLANDRDAKMLIHHAQIAVDQARRERRSIAMFDPAIEKEAAGGLALLSSLHAGLEDGSVWLSFQPKLELRTGHIIGAECLVRWNHPSRGPIGPDDFIPLAEKTGFIEPLTDWVFTRAIEGHAALAEAGHHIKVAINISARSLIDPDFARRLVRIASTMHADPADFVLELTETATLPYSADALTGLATLKREGFSLALDDYGTGQSSLSYLRRLPADEIKIDRMFVSNMAWDAKDAMLVRSTIEQIHTLGLRAVAEGVEDEKTLAMLTMFGCDQAQGYWIAHPMNLANLIRMLSERPAARAAS